MFRYSNEVEVIDCRVPSRLGVAALAAAAGGFHVLPVEPQSKRPLSTFGFRSATRDPVVIREWWRQWPTANIACVPGRSGLLVIDIDNEEGRAEAEALGLLHERTRTCATARGEHRYYQHPVGVIGVRKLAHHIDVRADRGYVVLPPSIHASGQPYIWTDTGQIARLPRAVAAMLEVCRDR